MTRKSYIQINGVLYDKAELATQEAPSLPAILGDIPAFVSPIDGTVVDGRRAFREHCLRHDVVPTQELKGLPTKPMVMPTSQAYRDDTKRTIAEIINSRNY